MTAAQIVLTGSPTADEAAAIVAAVEAAIAAEQVPSPALPWPYRSAWRHAAINEGATVDFAEWRSGV